MFLGKIIGIHGGVILIVRKIGCASKKNPPYNKNDPPYANVSVTLNPPKRTSLRKIDVFDSTITLDISKIAIIWKDIRLALNTTHSQRSIGIEQSFRDQIWRPEIIFQEMKSVRTKFLHTPDTGIFV